MSEKNIEFNPQQKDSQELKEKNWRKFEEKYQPVLEKMMKELADTGCEFCNFKFPNGIVVLDAQDKTIEGIKFEQLPKDKQKEILDKEPDKWK